MDEGFFPPSKIASFVHECIGLGILDCPAPDKLIAELVKRRQEADERIRALFKGAD